MTAPFGNLDTRELSKGEYQLLGKFWRDDPVLGRIEVAASFKTDYASIDVLLKLMMFMFYALLSKYGDKSATVHDWLYSGYGVVRADGSYYYPTRKECDQMFYRALRAEGVDRFRSAIFYCGVRIGGASHFTPKAWFTPEPMDAIEV